MIKGDIQNHGGIIRLAPHWMKLGIGVALSFVFCGNVLAANVRVRESKQPVSYADGFQLRGLRRIGLGVTGGGISGIAGLHVELNFTRELSVLGGIGRGPGYQNFHFQIKRSLGGHAVMPFLAAGFSRWSGLEQDISESTPAFLSHEILTQKEARSGLFGRTFIFPTGGLQFLQLAGPFAGFAVQAELNYLVEVEEWAAVATGGVGVTYYF